MCVCVCVCVCVCSIGTSLGGCAIHFLCRQAAQLEWKRGGRGDPNMEVQHLWKGGCPDVEERGHLLMKWGGRSPTSTGSPGVEDRVASTGGLIVAWMSHMTGANCVSTGGSPLDTLTEQLAGLFQYRHYV